MPFVERSAGAWVPKTEIGLRQLHPATVRFGRKARFRILEDFGYVHPRIAGAPPADVLPDPVLGVVQDETDLASVPPPLWGVIASYGTHTMPALLHDRLCAVAERQPGGGPALRRWADRHFRRMLRDEARAGIATRWAMWAGVRLFSSLPVGVTAVLWSGTAYAIAAQRARGRRVPRPLAVASLGAGSALVAAVVVRSVERPLDFADPAGNGPDRSQGIVPGARFQPAAAASLLGATGVGVLAVPVVAPAAVVNVVAVGTLRCLDLLAKVVSVLTLEPLARLYRRLRPYPEVPTDGVTGPGDDAVGAVLDEPWPALAPAFRRL